MTGEEPCVRATSANETGEVTIEAVVFDLGGVFTESPFEALRALGDSKGMGFVESLHVVFGPYDDDTDHPWHRAERGEIDLETVRREIRELGASRGVSIDLYELLEHMSTDGGVRAVVVETTRQLRVEGYRTALLTNNVAEFRDFWRTALPLDELFDVVVDSSEVGMRKPDPRIYEFVLESLGGVAPSGAVFLDDYPGNVEAARGLGMHGIVVDPDPVGALAQLDELLSARGIR